MNRICLALVALALISACKKPAPAVPVAADPVAAEPPALDWALTPARLEGYLSYQRTLLVQAGKLQAPAWDGGLKAFEEPTIEQKADADERARLAAGLTPDDVLKIEAMVSRVAAIRLTYRLMGLDQKAPQLPGPPVEGEVAEAAADQQANIKKQMEEMNEERKMFGSQNIDVLLQREDEVLKNWALMMQVPELSEKRR